MHVGLLNGVATQMALTMSSVALITMAHLF